jgi:hypothetical protein
MPTDPAVVDLGRPVSVSQQMGPRTAWHRMTCILFRDALLTSLATDQPGLMSISPTLLGHVSAATGQAHYNQARMLDAGKRFSANVSELCRGFLFGDQAVKPEAAGRGATRVQSRPCVHTGELP